MAQLPFLYSAVKLLPKARWTGHFSMVPARGSRTVQYLSFLAAVPEDFAHLRGLRLTDSEILLSDARGRDRVRVRASGLAATSLAKKS